MNMLKDAPHPENIWKLARKGHTPCASSQCFTHWGYVYLLLLNKFQLVIQEAEL